MFTAHLLKKASPQFNRGSVCKTFLCQPLFSYSSKVQLRSRTRREPVSDQVTDPFSKYDEVISDIRKGLTTKPLRLDTLLFPNLSATELLNLSLKKGVRGTLINENNRTVLELRSHNSRKKPSPNLEPPPPPPPPENASPSPFSEVLGQPIPVSIPSNHLAAIDESLDRFDSLMKDFGQEFINHYEKLANKEYVHQSSYEAKESPVLKAPRGIVSDQIAQIRARLPTAQFRQDLITNIQNHQVIVVTGTTGSGKSTQIPQYVLDDLTDVTRIMVVQPRRISAISLAQRVSEERGTQLGQTVGYQVRNDKKVSKFTQIVFVTTGILLRRFLVDPYLKGVSHIIMDEVHERTLNSDFCLTIIKRILACRADLKLVAMSATFNSELFSQYLSTNPQLPAPWIDIPGVSYPVKNIHLEEILSYSNQLIDFPDLNPAPKPGARAFQQSSFLKTFQKLSYDEINTMYEQMASQHPNLSPNVIKSLVHINYQFADDSQSRSKVLLLIWEVKTILYLLQKIIKDQLKGSAPCGAVLVFLPGWEDIQTIRSYIEDDQQLARSCVVLPLHSRVSPADQKRVFEAVPNNKVKVILATNVAETGITIADAVYVIDTGKVRESNFDPEHRIRSLAVQWITKANAKQRSGRAGRVRDGFCFRLYPQSFFAKMPEFPTPEIKRASLESVILHSILSGLSNGSVQTFLNSFIDPPSPDAVKASLDLLREMGAIDPKLERLTPLGVILANMPVEPLDGKLLVYAAMFDFLPPALTLVAAQQRDLFVVPASDLRERARSAQIQLAGNSNSDLVAIINGYQHAVSLNENERLDFCHHHFINPSAVNNISQIRNQLMLELDQSFFSKCSNSKNHSARLGSNYPVNLVRLRSLLVASLYPNFARIVRRKRSARFVLDSEREGTLSVGSIVDALDRGLVTPVNDWAVYTGLFVTRDLDSNNLTPALVFPTLVDTLCFLIFSGGQLSVSKPMGKPSRSRLPRLSSTRLSLVTSSSTHYFETNEVSASTLLRIRDTIGKLLTLQLAQSSHLYKNTSLPLTPNQVERVQKTQNLFFHTLFTIISQCRESGSVQRPFW